MRSVSSDKPDLSGKFVYWMMENRDAIYRYLYSLHPYPEELEDLLQETSLTLWKKINEFDEQRDFLPWALRIAYFEVLRWRNRMRQRRFVFSEEVLEGISEEIAIGSELFEQRSQALEECLPKLPQNLLDVVEQRYRRNGSVKALAKRWNTSANKAYKMLEKARLLLADCIQRKLET